MVRTMHLKSSRTKQGAVSRTCAEREPTPACPDRTVSSLMECRSTLAFCSGQIYNVMADFFCGPSCVL